MDTNKAAYTRTGCMVLKTEEFLRYQNDEDWDGPVFEGRMRDESDAEEVCNALNDAYEAGLQDGTILNVVNDTIPTSTDWYLVVMDEGESGIFTYAVEATSADEAEAKALEDSADDGDRSGHTIVSCWNCGKNAPKLT